MKENPHVTLAIKEALKSKYSIKVGCVIYKGKKIISKGHNVACFPIKLSSEYLRWKHSLHAEVSAIVHAIREEKNLTGATLIVVRINRSGKLMPSRPCKNCMKAIIDLTPIKKIVYSCSGGLILEKV